MKTSKSFNQEYIEKAKTLIHEILEDKKEYDDWTQICFSMQNAVQAAANIWGISSDEQINKMRAFITEMVLIELSNLKQFDIVFKKKGIRSLDTLYCPKCGNEVGPGQQFCSRCGAPQTPPPQSQTPPPPPSGGFQQPPGGSLENNKLILSVFAAICAAVYGLRTLGLVFRDRKSVV